MMSCVQGGNIWNGFASGALSSIAASAWSGGTNHHGIGAASGNPMAPYGGYTGIGKFLGAEGVGGMIAFGTIAGGAGAALTGGNFWQGAVTGLVVSGLNHAMNHGPGKKIKKSDDEKNIVRGKVIFAKEKLEQDNNYNFFYKRDDITLRNESEGRNVANNQIEINSHGAPTFVSAPDGTGMSGLQLHQYLSKNNNLYKDSMKNGTKITVRINACQTANGFGAEFSSYNPNMKVIAPTTNIVNVLGIFNYLKDSGVYLSFQNGIKQ